MTHPASSSTIEQIEQIIERHIRPYIEMDGGFIDLIRYENHVVYVRLSGSCETCTSASLTLKGGIERQIRRRMPEVRSVELDAAADSESETL